MSSSSTAGESHSSDSGADSSTSSGSTTKTTLNPLAEEWSLEKNRANEEKRCLFLTFSDGQPITESEITWFFNQFAAGCVQTVLMFRPDRRPPVCAKVVFRLLSIPRIILGTEEKAQFVVNGKPMWCKKYEPKNRKKHDENARNE